MTREVWIIIATASALAGAIASAWIAFRVLTARFTQRLNQHMQAYQQQHAGTMDKLRSAHAKARLEIEQQRAVMQRQVASAVAEQKATAARLEERLKVAYAELDRLRGDAAVPPAERSRIGFAETQPFQASR